MSIRQLTYSLAINEALDQLMRHDSSVFLIGQGVKSPWYVGNTVRGLLERYGDARVIDTPVSENAVTGAAVGAAICGMRPVVVHPRVDFMCYAIDPIVNQAANWLYMSGGRTPVPVVFWGIVNRGGEQGAQHSQSLHAFFSHVPGLKVVMPSTPYDAKGLMIAAVRDPNPVVFLDDRWLYGVQGPVPEGFYEVEIGKAAVRKNGTDVSLIGISFLAKVACEVAEELQTEGISVEVIDIRSAKPLDEGCILQSVKKTGRLVICDAAWRFCGLAGEIAALVGESSFGDLKAPIRRVTFPDCPAPASRTLEKAYFVSPEKIKTAVRELVRGR